MRGSAFIAFFGLASALGVSLIGCGDDDGDDGDDDGGRSPAPEVRKSGENESCARTDDCEDGLLCINNICLDSGSGSGGAGTGGSGTTGGMSGRGGSASSPLSGEGESCTRRADCQTDLKCFNQRCSMTDTGEAGAGNTPTPTLGGVGETCELSTDCGRGLLCIPGGGYGPGVGAVGVCTPADSGVTATGMVCGAECRDAEDCCELPIELHETLGVKSCVEIDEDLTGVNCGTTTNVAQLALCFARTAYCDCEDDAWLCEAGTCRYDVACSADGLVPDGCPTHSRTGRLLVATCDATDSERCQLPAVDPPCATDDDCEGLAVVDDPTDSCVADECVCFQNACYRRCAEDLDCRNGRICDAEDVCVPADACESHLTCQRLSGDIRAQCVGGGCILACQTDLDCNPGGLTGGAFARVCNDQGVCEAIGCTNDNDCGGTVNGAKVFCTTPEAAAGARAAESAITQ